MTTFFLIILSLISLFFATGFFILFWYCRKIGPIFAASQNLERIFIELTDYKKHLQYILSLEFYQGEQRILNLLKHTYALIEFIKKYDGVFTLGNPRLLELIQEEIDYEEEQKEQMKEEQWDEEKERTN